MSALNSNPATRLLGDLGRSVRDFRRQAGHHKPAPPESGFVLDVGAGHAPHPRSDLIVDKYVEDDFERQDPLAMTRPLVVADGEHLPFADRTFSYVIASHVLEHAIDPVAFASEMARVGAAGFVQVPSRQAELTFGWPFHPWLIDLEDGTLVFNPRGDLTAPLGQFWHDVAADSSLFGLWFGANRSTFHHTVHWTGSIPVRVSGESRAPQTAGLDIEQTIAALKRLGARGPAGQLRDALRCPADGGQLEDRPERIVCLTCERSYPAANQVPILLLEAAV